MRDDPGPDGEREFSVIEDPKQKVFECPECHEIQPSAEALGTHIERHREVLPEQASPMGKSLTFPCPKGCGRHFRPGCAPKGEINAHIKSCDGQMPLPATGPKAERKEETVANLDCPKCGKKYDRGGHYRDLHVKICGAPKPARKPARKSEDSGEREPLVVPDNGGLTIKDRILGLLEVEEDRLTNELGQCRALIASVRESGGKDRPT